MSFAKVPNLLSDSIKSNKSFLFATVISPLSPYINPVSAILSNCICLIALSADCITLSLLNISPKVRLMLGNILCTKFIPPLNFLVKSVSSKFSGSSYLEKNPSSYK